jgi:hypothetical protein
MELLGIEFLAANSNRNYPLEDRATKRDDTGLELPVGLLSDLHVSFPDDLGRTAFISSVTVSPSLVTLTLCAASGRALQEVVSGPFQPLAAISAPRPVRPGRHYAMTPLADGVAGWVSFGQQCELLGAASYRFSLPTQSALLPRAAVAYPQDGVLSVGRPGVKEKLHRVVRLRSSNPDLLHIGVETLTIDGADRTAIVLRLNEEKAGKEVYERFIGPCGGSPASLTCRRPPIHSIDGVNPDCSGLITVYIREKQNPEPGALNGELTLSYAATDADGTEPGDPTGKIHTAGLDFTVSIDDICPSVPDKFLDDKDDNCDDPCLTWDDKSPLVNRCYYWLTGYVEEPGYQRGVRFITPGEVASIDVTGFAGITITGAADDVMIMVPEGVSVDQTPTMETYVLGDPVTFGVPANAIFFEDTSGWIITDEMTNATAHFPASAEKTFTDGTHTYTYPQGNAGNNATGHVSDLAGAGFIVKPFNTTISISELRDLGYITDNQLKFRFFHVVSGWGFGGVNVLCPQVDNTERCEGEQL